MLAKENSPTIHLVKHHPGDFEIYYTLVKDDTVMKYVSGKGLTREEARKKFNTIINTNSENADLGYFKVYNSHDIYIGDAKLAYYEYDHNLLEIGYILKEEFWGKGYGTAICKLLLHKAAIIAPNVDLVGIIEPENTASRKLLEKFGFKGYFVGVEDGLPTEKLKLSR